jgi:hypothetical protein
MMRSHTFEKKPKFCVAFRPSMIWVRCAKCGAPHEEYFGPDDRDEKGAENQLLRRELEAAAAIVSARSLR